MGNLCGDEKVAFEVDGVGFSKIILGVGLIVGEVVGGTSRGSTTWRRGGRDTACLPKKTQVSHDNIAQQIGYTSHGSRDLIRRGSGH